MPSEATLMDLEIIILSEISHRKTISYDISYMWNLNGIMNLLTKKKRLSENKLIVTKGKLRIH